MQKLLFKTSLVCMGLLLGLAVIAFCSGGGSYSSRGSGDRPTHKAGPPEPSFAVQLWWLEVDPKAANSPKTSKVLDAMRDAVHGGSAILDTAVADAQAIYETLRSTGMLTDEWTPTLIAESGREASAHSFAKGAPVPSVAPKGGDSSTQAMPLEPYWVKTREQEGLQVGLRFDGKKLPIALRIQEVATEPKTPASSASSERNVWITPYWHKKDNKDKLRLAFRIEEHDLQANGASRNRSCQTIVTVEPGKTYVLDGALVDTLRTEQDAGGLGNRYLLLTAEKLD